MKNLFLCLALAGAALLSGCTEKQHYKYLVVFSQCNNAEPYRAAQNAQMKKLWAKYPDVKLVEMDAQQDSVRQIAQNPMGERPGWAADPVRRLLALVPIRVYSAGSGIRCSP